MIYYFSGTGNSMWVGRQLGTLLGENLVEIAVDESAKSASLPCNGRVVWVFPVYAWGLPVAARRFMMNATGGMGSRHYLVAVCGDDIGLTHEEWRELLRRKDLDGAAAFSVQMPNTYTALPGFDVDSPEVERHKLEAASARIEHIARMITGESRTDDVVTGAVPWIKSRILRPLFNRFLIDPQRFTCDHNLCTRCGRCVAQCPQSNIVKDSDGCPSWGSNCSLCLGCYHVCPVHAVNYGKATLRKGQYICPLR